MHILPEYQLLKSGHEYRDMVVDLWGTVDSEGVECCDVSLHGDKRSLHPLILERDLEGCLTEAATAQYLADGREANREARIWAKAMDKSEVFA